MGTVRDIVSALFVRTWLVLHSLLTIWRAADVQKNDLYWLLGLTNLILLAETLYTVIKRKGQERKWFCPCFLLYLFGTLPAVWFLELERIDRYDQASSSSNVSSEQTQALSSIYGVSLPLTLEPDVWISLLEQSLIFLLIIGRWLLPRGELTRKQLSQLLFVYIGAGSDILEFFIVFELGQVRADRILSYVSLAVWSLSLLQFTLVLTATKSHHKDRAVLNDPEEDKQMRKKANFCERLLITEIWSLLLSTMLLDFPFLCVRVYILIVMKILSYGILFFTCKNIILIMVVIYRIVILCADKFDDDDDDDDDEKGEKDDAVSKENGKISNGKYTKRHSNDGSVENSGINSGKQHKKHSGTITPVVVSDEW